MIEFLVKHNFLFKLLKKSVRADGLEADGFVNAFGVNNRGLTLLKHKILITGII